MRLDRREFVRCSSWAAGLAFAPDWLARGFAADQDPATKAPATRAGMLRAARRRAVGRGKPLLVFVVPADKNERRERGQLFGALLNQRGRNNALLDLALCEPACATIAEVRADLGDPAGIEGEIEIETGREPMWLVVEPRPTGDPAAAAWRVRAIAPDLGRPPGLGARFSERKEYWSAAHTELAAALHEAVAPDPGVLAERADRERGTMAEDEHRALEQLFAHTDEPPPDELLLRAAAVVLMAAEAPRRRGDRARLVQYLLKAARRTYVQQRLPGSKWANSAGCGTFVEGEGPLGVVGPCGTGFVPPMCRRFLYFYSE